MKLVVAIAFILITSCYADDGQTPPKKISCIDQCYQGNKFTKEDLDGALGTTVQSVPPQNSPVHIAEQKADTYQSLNDQNPDDNPSLRKLRRSTPFQHHKRYFRGEAAFNFPNDLNNLKECPKDNMPKKESFDACYILNIKIKKDQVVSSETVRFGGENGYCNSKEVQKYDKKGTIDLDCAACSLENCNADKDGKVDEQKPEKEPEKEPEKKPEQKPGSEDKQTTAPGSQAAPSTAKPADESSAGRIEYGFSQLFLLTLMVLGAWLKK